MDSYTSVYALSTAQEHIQYSSSLLTNELYLWRHNQLDVEKGDRDIISKMIWKEDILTYTLFLQIRGTVLPH